MQNRNGYLLDKYMYCTLLSLVTPLTKMPDSMCLAADDQNEETSFAPCVGLLLRQMHATLGVTIVPIQIVKLIMITGDICRRHTCLQYS